MQCDDLQTAPIDVEPAVVVHKHDVHVAGAAESVLDPLRRLVLPQLEPEQPDVLGAQQNRLATSAEGWTFRCVR